MISPAETSVRAGFNRQVVGAAFDQAASNPVVHAQFDACFAFAAALVDGWVNIATLTPRRIVAGDVAWATRLHTPDAENVTATVVLPARCVWFYATDGCWSGRGS